MCLARERHARAPSATVRRLPSYSQRWVESAVLPVLIARAAARGGLPTRAPHVSREPLLQAARMQGAAAERRGFACLFWQERDYHKRAVLLEGLAELAAQ